MRIFRQEGPPGAQYNGEVFGQRTILGYVIVDQFILFGEGEKTRAGKMICDAHHHRKIRRIRNIAGGVPAEEPAFERRDFDLLFKERGIIPPDFQITRKQFLRLLC